MGVEEEGLDGEEKKRKELSEIKENVITQLFSIHPSIHTPIHSFPLSLSIFVRGGGGADPSFFGPPAPIIMRLRVGEVDETPEIAAPALPPGETIGL